jgi:hypothetical protein
MLSFVLWDACEAVSRAMPSTAPADEVYPWIQGIWLGISLIPAGLLHMAVTYPEARPRFRRRLAIIALYTPFIGWAYLILRTDVVIAGVSSNYFGPSALVGPTYFYSALVYSAWFYAGVGSFVRQWWRVRKRVFRRMQGIVVIGLLVGTIPGGITEIFWPFLSGGNTQLGLGSLYTLTWSVFFAVAIGRYRYLVIEPVMEAPAPRQARHPLEGGQNYLVLEAGRSAGMGAFRQLVGTTPGLCVTGLSPARVSERVGLARTPIVWITNVTSGDRSVRPQGLDFELVHTILKFLRENPGTAVLLDDLDYLASVNGFEAVARFLKRVANQASVAKGTLIVTAGYGTFGTEELATLGGCVDRVIEIQEAIDVEANHGRRHDLRFVAVQTAPLAVAVAGGRRGLLFTTDHAAKVRKRFGNRFDVVWITDHPEPGEMCVRPSALDTEAKRALVKYLGAHPGCDIVLMGLEQLILLSGFPAVLAFVKDTLDLGSVKGGRVIATLAPKARPLREVAMLARRFDVAPGPLILKGSPAGGPATTAAGSRTPSRGPVS